MNDITKARLLLLWPRRDWRFWAAISAATLLLCVAVAMFSALGRADRSDARADGLQRRVDELVAAQSVSDDVRTCVSEAAVWADLVGHEETAIQSLGLAEVGRGGSTAQYADALIAATANSRAALEARVGAVTTCATNPAYRIDPAAVLEPVPPYPHQDGS